MPSEPCPDDEATAAQITKSGITTTADGNRHIPSSVRGDGSVRKEIRIRPGYRPPEDVEVYRNRTSEAWKNRGKGGVPGAEVAEEPSTSGGSDGKDGAGTGAAAKNAKRREARKKAAATAAAAANAAATAAGDLGKPEKGSSSSNASEKGNDKGNTKKDEEAALALDPEAEKEKEARKLAKKLRQARDLKDKKDSGSALLPEQFEKVIRINELIRQLNVLGYDNQGERKMGKGTSDAGAS